MPSTKSCLLMILGTVSFAASVFTRGVLTIMSACPYNVYFQVCPADCCTINLDGTVTCPPWILLKPFTTWKMPYSHLSPNETVVTGVSIKIGTGGPSITQLEMAWNPTAGQEFYDISNLNNNDEAGNVIPGPFQNEGYVLWADQPASADFPTCQTLHCGAGEFSCQDGYWKGEAVDKHGESIANHIMACSDSANLFLDLCSG